VITIDRSHLDRAASALVITPRQAQALWDFLGREAPAALAASSTDGAAGQPQFPLQFQQQGPRFTFTNVLYYLGGMMAIGAMSTFMTLGWASFGSWGVFFIALLYAGISLWLARWFEGRSLEIPMGLMAALVVVLVPLATWALQHALGFWPDGGRGATSYRAYHYVIDWRWITLEFATLFAGVAMLYRWKAPFLLMPVAVTLWYMTMDLAMLILPENARGWDEAAWTFRKWFSVASGLIIVLVGFSVDLRSRLTRDYAFWLYLFGLLAFWCGLTSLGDNKLAGKLIYLAINLGLVFIGAVLVRRAFTVFGAIGIAIVLGDISWRFFKNSWFFPIALTAIGLAVIFAGVWWSRNEARLTDRLQGWLPQDLRELLSVRRATVAS
jgi:hypothetical protein